MMANYKTINTIIAEFSSSDDVVIRYKGWVCVARLNYRDTYDAEIYEFCEEPDIDGIAVTECRLALIEDSSEPFKTSGEAIKWCFDNIDKF